MPLSLPAGRVPVVHSARPALADARTTSFRFDLYEVSRQGSQTSERHVATLEGVDPSGGVSWDPTMAIAGGGSIDVTDRGQVVDWLGVRIKPTATILTAGQTITMPCGVFIPSAPVENWTVQGLIRKVELLDKCSILDQDVVTDPDTGQALTYSLPITTRVTDAVKQLIDDVGEFSDGIIDSSETLLTGMTWDIGTTRLTIINDLLSAIGYTPLMADLDGKFRSGPYVDPSSRPIEYVTLQPFEGGSTSVLSPEWERDRDIYAVPNRMVVTSQSTGTLEALISTVTNVDPESPFSYPSRGFWVTQVLTDVEVVGQYALDNYAHRKMQEAMGVAGVLTIKHPLLPNLRVGSVVRFTNGTVDSLCEVTDTEIQFDPTALVTTKLKEVLVS